MDNRTIIINTNYIDKPMVGNDIFSSRSNFYNSFQKENAPMVSICVLAFNRLEKTRKCVESIIKYTKNINYELFLLDNGSDEDTLDYFKSIDYEKKYIIRSTTNIVGAKLLFEKFYELSNGKYIAQISNDVYVTEKWLSNIVKCFESDNMIGMVTPMSSNVSNLQQVNLNFNSFEEMQYQASLFNESNPIKWEERMRLVTPMAVIKREVLELVGRPDCGFFHDFSEDDWTLRIRRAGYKLILCGDTFVHHDHDFRNMEDKDPILYKKSLEIGANDYKQKYHGLDAWEDILNFERNLIHMIPDSEICKRIKPNLLAIDIKCGTPILEVKNYLKSRRVSLFHSSAFTTKAKYYEDLKSITEDVECDRIEYLTDYYSGESFDYIILGEPLNMFDKPILLLRNILSLLKKKGVLLVKLRNTTDINTLLNIVNKKNKLTGDMPIHIEITDLYDCLRIMNVKNIKVKSENYNIDNNVIETIERILEKTEIVNNVKESLSNLLVYEYLIAIVK